EGEGGPAQPGRMRGALSCPACHRFGSTPAQPYTSSTPTPQIPAQNRNGVLMANQTASAEDFEHLLMESFQDIDPVEGTVVKGTVVAIEKDLAIIDVGLKTEGRVPLKEFGAAGRDGTIDVGSEVEVYVDRVENAIGEAVLSREKARREESWVRLEALYEKNEKVEGQIFNQVKG